MIMDLPRSVIDNVLVEWLRIDDLPRLDSAHCESAGRLSFLQLISGPHMVNFEHNRNCPERTKRFMKWALLRKIRICEFTIFRCLAVVPQALQARVQEIAETAEFKSESPFKPSRPPAMYGGNVTSTSSESSEVGGFYPNVFKSVLGRSASNIRELKIDLSQSSTLPNCAYFTGISCPKLQKLEFTSPTTYHQVRNICTAAPNLRILNGIGQLSADALTEFTTGPALSKLWSLDLSGSAALTDVILETLLKRSPHISVLRIASCPLLTDSSFRAIAKHCKLLTSLDASHLRVSSAALSAVLVVCAKRLRILHLASCENLAHHCLVTIQEHCPNLTTLDISHTHFEEKHMREALSKLTLLTHFSCASTSAADGILQVIAQHCPRIKALNLAQCLYLTPIGVYALIMRCRSLRLLHVHISSLANNAANMLTLLYNTDLSITTEPDVPPARPKLPSPLSRSIHNRNRPPLHPNSHST